MAYVFPLCSPKHNLRNLQLPSNRVQSISWFSGLVSAGYLLNRLATKAKFSLGFPLTTSAGVTNCLQPNLSACWSILSALFKSSVSCWSKIRRVFFFKGHTKNIETLPYNDRLGIQFYFLLANTWHLCYCFEYKKKKKVGCA